MIFSNGRFISYNRNDPPPLPYHVGLTYAPIGAPQINIPEPEGDNQQLLANNIGYWRRSNDACAVIVGC